MTYSIVIPRLIHKQLERIPKKMSRKIRDHIRDLAHDPCPDGCKKLAGKQSYYRIRIGHYRVVYEIEDGKLIISLIEFGHRKEIYRNF